MHRVLSIDHASQEQEKVEEEWLETQQKNSGFDWRTALFGIVALFMVRASLIDAEGTAEALMGEKRRC